MSEEWFRVPTLTEGGYTARECSVCGIEDIIGTNAEYCDIHFSEPELEYDYAFDYVNLFRGDELAGYYIGIDRFFRVGGEYKKEYVIREYAIFSGEDGALLLRHLCELARGRGCSRIVAAAEGGNKEFYTSLSGVGFTSSALGYTLELSGVSMARRDLLVIPREGEALGHEVLFFLREQKFVLDEKKCSFKCRGEEIIIERSTGACHFSAGFSPIGEQFILSGSYALSVIDVCIQLLKLGVEGSIRITPESELSDGLSVAVSVGDAAVIITERSLNLKERRELRARLKREGVYKRYAVHRFQFDFELGGERVCFGFVEI